MSRALLLALSALALLVGCGGNVVVDGPGPGGGGPGVDPVVQACIDVCEEMAVDCGPVSPCDESCAQGKVIWDAAGCATEAADFYECFVDVPNKCTSLEDCLDPAIAYSDCVTPYCNQNPDACTSE